jgi:poly(3-hydroxybutyrate) depolymerase
MWVGWVRSGSSRCEVALGLLVVLATAAAARDGPACARIAGWTQALPVPRVTNHTGDRLIPYDGRSRQMPMRDVVCGMTADDQVGLQADEQIIDDEDEAEQWVCGRHVIVRYTFTGEGHSWPGSSVPARITRSDVHATATMWAFFRQCGARQPEQGGGHP